MNQMNQINHASGGANNAQNNPPKDNLILFFHEQSPACQKLKSLIPKDKNINIVNVEQLQSIPASITSIPSLVINNNKILKGKEVFDYFNKSEEMEYINFSGKGSSCGFSCIDDDTIQSNSAFSSIDNMEYTGVPSWSENDEQKSVDISKLQEERDNHMKIIQESPK